MIEAIINGITGIFKSCLGIAGLIVLGVLALIAILIIGLIL